MNTKEIMDLALEVAGLSEMPEDCGIIVEGDNIKRILVGVDMDTSEILLGRELKVDLVMSHHPGTGLARLELHKVMKGQIDRMVTAGVPINKAQKVLQEAIDKVARATHPMNYDRIASAAKLLNMPYMNIHTPADVIAERTVQAHLDSKLNEKSKLKDVMEALLELPEYKNTKAQPIARVGSDESYAGKVFVTMAGGTGGGPEVLKSYFDAGIGTLVVMHIPEDSLKAVKDQGIGNVIVAGHMASDSIGMNGILKALEERGIEVIRASGIVDYK